jgi:hypothetical protein
MHCMPRGRSIAAAARAAASNRTVRRVAGPVLIAAARRVGPMAQERYGLWRDRRVDRDRALKLARQMGGRYSEDTIIGGRPHFVVWKDDRPVAAFPEVDDLASRPELASFDPRLAREPPPLRRRRGAGLG